MGPSPFLALLPSNQHRDFLRSDGRLEAAINKDLEPFSNIHVLRLDYHPIVHGDLNILKAFSYLCRSSKTECEQ